MFAVEGIFLQIITQLTNFFSKITNWESWPFKLIYAPLIPVWLWYAFKSRRMWFFTPSNPKLTFGGMEGEPKKEMYNLLPPEYYPITFNVIPSESFLQVKLKLNSFNISYPFIVKPEIGGQGILFRKINDENELKTYHRLVPVEYIIQQLVNYPMEVSVFYIRHPNESKGRVTGFLHKIPLHVIGNGKDSLQQLVKRHPKAAKRRAEIQCKHKGKWLSVIGKGEKYILSYAANHNRGAHFVDLKNKIDQPLVDVFDEISHRIDDFFYGRYDIMCKSIEDLKQGKNFSILEYNGCGAEPNHFYDTGYTLGGAYKEILLHWKALHQISEYNRSTGIEPWPYQKGVDYLKRTTRHFRLMKEADEIIA
jgi:hypothetical protein